MSWVGFKVQASRVEGEDTIKDLRLFGIFLILTVFGTGLWAWSVTDGNLVVWFSLTLLASTPILSIGWFLLSLIARNRRGELLTPKVQNALELKGRWPHHSRKS